MADSSENPADPPPRPAVSAAIFRGRQVLLGQRSKPPLQGVWSLPGGHMEAGEEACAAVTRELLEETGVTADILGVAEIADVIVKGADGSVRARYEITVFFGIWASGEPRAGSDCQAVRWADRHALDALELTDGTAEIVAKAQRLISQRGI